MLLRNKKTQGEEQNWCLILNPLRNEIDKKKIAVKIAQVFSLSPEEASDLVANTPIILLDNLTREVASKLKDYFLSTGADMLLTNDILQKRKCYRTVWPEPPKLTFLLDWSSLEEKGMAGAVQPPEDSIVETRSFLPEKSSAQEPKPQNAFQDKERERLLEEIERWRKECLSFQDESRRLKEEIEKGVGKAILSQDYSESAEFGSQIKEKEKEIKELRLLYSNAQEKHEMLKEESRETRVLYEEKITFLTRENEQWKRKIQELNTAMQALQQGLHKEKQSAAELFVRHDGEIKRAKEDYEDSSRLLRENLSRSLAEIEQAKLQSRQAVEKSRILETAKETLERKLNELTDQLAQDSEKIQGFLRREQELEARFAQEKSLREKIEQRAVELEHAQPRLMHELEAVSEEVRRCEARALELEKEVAQIRAAYENQEKTAQTNSQLLEARERELESVRRQLRDVHQHWEQREAVQRRTQLANQLLEKESLLKKMVQEQEKIEREIREREESMRKVLSDQEAIEKEIIEAKQAQRHMTEQAKRERSGKFKNGSKDPAELEPAPQETE